MNEQPIVLAIIGLIAYFVFSVRRRPVDDVAEWENRSAEEIEAEVYESGHMTASQRVDDMFR